MTALKNQGKTLKRYLNKTPEKRGITPVIYPLHPTNRGLTCGICNSPSQAGPQTVQNSARQFTLKNKGKTQTGIYKSLNFCIICEQVLYVSCRFKRFCYYTCLYAKGMAK
jgi:hypothetical protein